MSLSASISFKSERFDYQSELPEDINAGNRFYGRDLAEFLLQQLRDNNILSDYLDEDWGWLVFSQKNQSPIFEIAVYNLAEHQDSEKRGIPEWGLWIRVYESRKLFGIFSKQHEVAVPPEFLGAVEGAVRAAGAIPALWKGGPGDA